MADLHVVVFDDLRTFYPERVGMGDLDADHLHHCRTEREFLNTLDSLNGNTLIVMLDHDLGGVAFGPETSRVGITEMCKRYRTGRFDIMQAFVITANPAGGDWIMSECRGSGILTYRDPFGQQLAMDQGT